MGNSNGGDSMLKVVELFIDNINESTKTLSQGMDRVETKVEGVKAKVNTPPRNEELSKDHEDLGKKLDTVLTSVDELKTATRLMINTVRVAVAVLTFAALLSGAVVYFGNRSLVSQLNPTTKAEVVQDVQGKGDINENVSR